MQCSEIQELLADALGGELSGERLNELNAHLASCASCRAERENLALLQVKLRALPGPAAAQLAKEGERWSLAPGPSLRPNDVAVLAPSRRGAPAFMRRAAGILIAFTAGYAAHALLTLSARREVSDRTPPRLVRSVEGDDLRRAVALAHQARPATSDLAKVMTALGKRNR